MRSSTLNSREEIVVAGLQVRICRKRVKNLNVRLRPEIDRVVVSAPSWVSIAQIEAFITKKAAWIKNRQKELQASPSVLAHTASAEEMAAWKAMVGASAPVLVEVWEPIIGVKAGKLAYRNMTSRWGSCQPSTGRICLNTRLALYPPECLEYVVVHELCHLLETGHGPRFRALMDEFMPDWRQRRNLLKS